MKRIMLFLCAVLLSVIGYSHGFESNAIVENATGNGNGTISSYNGLAWTPMGQLTWIEALAEALPPAGSDCSDAIDVQCNENPVIYSSVGSTALAPAGCTMGDNGLWFSFMGTGRDITINSSATFDHALSVNTGSCGSLTSVVCQDDSTAAENYAILSSVKNQMYFVYIAHKSSGNTTTGNIQISIECAAPQYPPVVELNSAGDYGVLAATGITSAGASVIRNTNIGVNPATRAAITGFPPSEVINGEIHASDSSVPIQAKLAQAQLDLTAAYNFAAGASVPAPATISGDQGGVTLFPGIYKSTSSLMIQNGDLTLDAQGDPNARWIFQIASTLTTVSGGAGNVILTNGAQAKNITWQVGSSATIATSFKGNILALVSVTMGVGSTSDGRLYASNGLVALSGNILIDQPCVAPKNLAASNVSTDSADITWTKGATETEWEVIYGPANFDPYGTQGTTVSVLINPQTTLNNLDGGTDYDVYIRAICDVTNEIEWTGPVSFSTFCGVATVPYLLDFDSVVVPNLPDCTSEENNGIGNDWKTKSNISEFTGNVLNYSTHNSIGNANSWFYTQGVALFAGTNYQISYRYGNLSSSSTESMKVAYGITPTETSMTISLADYPTISSTTPLDELISFTVATDGVYYFGFNAYSSANQNQLYVDDISIVKEIITYVYENLVWTPGDPSGVSTESDYIKIINGTTSLTANTAVNDLTIQSGATLNINKVLSLSGDITNNGDLVFVSTPTGNGELGPVPATSTITGDATVQRYYMNKRSYRMVSSAVTTTTSIHVNWQEGATSSTDNPFPAVGSTPGFGTHITGTFVDQQNGFDATSTGNPSMFFVANGAQEFTAIGNTNGNLTAGDAYLLFVRGDRGIDLTDPGNNLSSETILRTRGSLKYGPQPIQTFNTTTTNQFVMFGNPYQSAIDVNLLFANAGASNVNPNHYYVYDPSLGVNGAYVYVTLPAGTSTTDADEFLQPGQAGQFATLANGNSALQFTESVKAPGNFTSTNRPISGNDMLTVKLYTTENFNNGGPMHDSFGITFANGNDNGLTPVDAVKPMNFYENLGIDHNGTYLIYEYRDMPQPAEVYPLYTSGYNFMDYTLKLTVDGLEATFLYLDDHFTGTSTLLEVGDNSYSFSVDAGNSLSTATDRFSIHTAQRLGVDNNSMLSDIRLFPNPLDGNTFYINAPRLNGEQLSVSISDLSGRRIYDQNLECNANTVTVPMGDNLASGIYMVTLKHGGEAHTYRLIKK